MKSRIDYKTLGIKAYKTRIKLLKKLRKSLDAMVSDSLGGSVSARASAAKHLAEIDAELVGAEQARTLPSSDKVKELVRENQRYQLRVAELERRVVELEASLTSR